MFPKTHPEKLWLSNSTTGNAPAVSQALLGQDGAVNGCSRRRETIRWRKSKGRLFDNTLDTEVGTVSPAHQSINKLLGVLFPEIVIFHTSFVRT
jgi:hypothetical protein